jgi:hypothetical protein
LIGIALIISTCIMTYVYDRAVCTGLGDRVGALMTLATLARVHDVEVVFRWCGDPSEIYPTQRAFMPKWHGFDYNLTEFQRRFWPDSLQISMAYPNLTREQLESPYKIVWQGLRVPAESALDQIYPTAWMAVEVPGRPVPDPETYKESYRWVARSVMVHALAHNSNDLRLEGGYIALHMRGPDDNTYSQHEGCHDSPKLYCTTRVVNRLRKEIPRATIVVLTNNAEWAKQALSPKKVVISQDVDDYDDLALLLGAKAIVQHANFGWSSYSSNPAMIAGVPLLTTFRRRLVQEHRFNIFKNYGGIPDEFHDCEQIPEFVQKVKEKFS